MIVKRGEKWCVESHQTGRSFGCYSSRDEAQKRLSQIKMFKHIKQAGKVWSKAGK